MRTAEKRAVFEKIFRTGTHGSTGECHCGVHHYDSANHWDNDHAEHVLPTAQANAAKHPECFQLHDHAIEYVDFSGRLYVIDCKCGMDNFIFELLVEDQQRILSFYKQTQDHIKLSDLNITENPVA
jgi:hypothetical protein